MSYRPNYFEDLRRRFPPESAYFITQTQQQFELMGWAPLVKLRPPESRTASFVLGGVPFIVWQLDSELDCFQIFATTYYASVGILSLSSNPAGALDVRGYKIDLALVAQTIRDIFKNDSSLPAIPQKYNLLLFGFSGNLGHHLWNEVSGLSTAMQCGAFDSIDMILLGPYDYFHLEPFLRSTGKAVQKLNALGTMASPHILKAWSELVVSREAREFVLNNAAKCSENLPAPPLGKRSICFQIRRHSRVWVREEEGIAEIIAACGQLWPGTIFYIDGHSLSDNAPAPDPKILAEEVAFAERMASRFAPQGIEVRSIVGANLNAKLNFYRHVDLFVGTIGTGWVLTSWVMQKPSVIYGPHYIYELVLVQEPTVPEGGPYAVAVPPTYVKDLGNHEFDIDPQIILQYIREAMNKLESASFDASGITEPVAKKIS